MFSVSSQIGAIDRRSRLLLNQTLERGEIILL